MQTGGLLSDVFLHLIPHAFLGEHQDSNAHFVMVEDKRNILIGFVGFWLTYSNCSSFVGRLGIFVGFATFFIMEKSLRVLGSDEGDQGHPHGHSHSHSHMDTSANAVTSGVSITSSTDGLRVRGGEKRRENDQSEQVDQVYPGTGPSKLSAYLNLFGDFVHNMYDLFSPLCRCPSNSLE